MTDLALHGRRVGAVLDLVRDMAVAQAVRHRIPIRTQRIPIGGEPILDLPRLQPTTPLRQPQRWLLRCLRVPRPGVGHVVGHGLHRPGHHRQGRAPPPRRALRALAVAHVQGAELPHSGAAGLR